MGCDYFKQIAHDYFMEALTSEHERELQEHLGSCSECGDFMRLCSEISCRELCSTLDEYLSGECPGERREVIDRHLELCKDCRDYLESYRKVMSLSALALGPSGPMPAMRVPEELVRIILRARGSGRDDCA